MVPGGSSWSWEQQNTCGQETKQEPLGPKTRLNAAQAQKTFGGGKTCPPRSINLNMLQTTDEATFASLWLCYSLWSHLGQSAKSIVRCMPTSMFHNSKKRLRKKSQRTRPRGDCSDRPPAGRPPPWFWRGSELFRTMPKNENHGKPTVLCGPFCGLLRTTPKVRNHAKTIVARGTHTKCL